MQKLFVFVVASLFLASFVVANDVVNAESASDVFIHSPVDPAPVDPAQIEPKMYVKLSTPLGGASFDAPDGVVNLAFYFAVESNFLPESDVVNYNLVADVLVNDASQAADSLSQSSDKFVPVDCKVMVRKDGEAPVDLKTIFVPASLEGKAEANFVPGAYKWGVTCEGTAGSWNSEERLFTVKTVVVPSVVSSSGESTGSIGGNSIRRSGGSLPPIQNLANDNQDDSDLDRIATGSDRDSSWITGAVIGALGEKGALGVGIFIVIVGVAALVVFNKRKISVKN